MTKRPNWQCQRRAVQQDVMSKAIALIVLPGGPRYIPIGAHGGRIVRYTLELSV
jgi:hypothetical protein